MLTRFAQAPEWFLLLVFFGSMDFGTRFIFGSVVLILVFIGSIGIFVLLVLVLFRMNHKLNLRRTSAVDF